nr:hypothetical protein [Bradyrhizobium barranii]
MVILAIFQLTHTAQSVLPVLLQLRSDQAIIGVTGGVATLSKRGIVPGLLEFQIKDPALVCMFRGIVSTDFRGS